MALYVVIASISVEPKDVECSTEEREGDGSLVVLVIVEGGVG
jgi:hypothetical protein